MAAKFLVLASLVFYGFWDSRYLVLLAASILFNFQCGVWVVLALRQGVFKRAKKLFGLAVMGNLAILGYYKYANFFLTSIGELTGLDWQLSHIVLPLGISFFTFTQIAYLADCLQGKVTDFRLTHYALFVTYFPHLIAGPVLHHREMMPQFARAATYLPSAENFAVGLSIFFIGLFKKVVIADGIAPYVSPVFTAAAQGHALTLVEANVGALSYALQLYFDFSGYSDMAIGLSRLFGVVLPSNFQSPYKAINIIDFWRRWHMTLSRFLRDYLYIPLGGNRSGALRRYTNLLLTMLLGGLWHGAAWTFVIWGGLHGAMLMVNHGWHKVRRLLGHDLHRFSWWGRFFSRALTFYSVMLAWVFFRADSLSGALAVVRGMWGLNGILLPSTWRSTLEPFIPWLNSHSITFGALDSLVVQPPLNWFGWLLGIAWLLPNTQQFMMKYRPVLDPILDGPALSWLTWKPQVFWAALIAFFGFVGIGKISKVSEFLYFQF